MAEVITLGDLSM